MNRMISKFLFVMSFISVSRPFLTPSVDERSSESRCVWTDVRKVKCQIKTLGENFSSWITQESWPVTTNFTSSSETSGLSSSSMISSSSLVTSQSSPQRYRDVTRVTSLTIECLPLELESFITEATFRDLGELTFLKIANCKLSSIPEGSLVILSQLRQLEVTSMRPERTLRVQTNSLPSSLEKIQLSHNSIWSLPEDAFCGFKSLLLLDLSANRFHNVEDLGLGPSRRKETEETRRIATDGSQISETKDNVNANNILADSDVIGSDYTHKDVLEYDFGSSATESLNVSLVILKNREDTSYVSCDGSVRSLILDHNAITRLPKRSFRETLELRSIFISNNEIEVISDEAFAGLDTLEVLDMSNNRITSLYNRTFRDCVRMEKLYLRNNSLTGFSSDIFRNMMELQILDLSWNHLTLQVANVSFFKGLRRLVILNLSHNRLPSISLSLLQDLSAMQRLDLSHNLLTSIDEEIFRTAMFNLYELNLSHNKLLSISSSSFSGLAGLNILNLESNSLNELHPSLLVQSSNLRKITLANNKFESIPTAVQNMSFLNHLDISHNNILKVEFYNFDRLSNLRVVNLSSNIISNVTSHSFKGLKSLRILDLSDNNINNIGEGALDSISGLKFLYLSRNKLVNLNAIFAGMESLEVLNLSENYITMFDYAFLPRQLLKLILAKNEIKNLGNHFKVHNVLALEEIDASFNNIQTISEESLPNTVKKVHLEQNKIKEVKPGTFREKLNIEFINLRMNQISKLNPKSVSPQWVTKYQEKAVLFLGGNSLVCDCETEWLFSASTNTNNSSENPETDHRLPVIGDVSDTVCILPHSVGNVTTYAKIIQTSPEDYLCPYATHCFTVCHCCDFIACDCQMKCPTSCSCFHDATWSMNLVDCSRGSLERLPDKVPMDATVVFLDGNNLRVLHAHQFIGRHSIQKLYLNNSNIQTLQNRTFHGLASLKYLFLQDNMIVKLNEFEFSGLTHLKELHLHNNRISFLHNNTFVGLKMLEVLRIDNNFLMDFPVWVLSRNMHLKSVYLSSNPWDCNCEFIRELGSWVRTHGQLIFKSDELSCIVNSGTVMMGISEPNFVCALERRDITHRKFGQRELPFLAGGLCGGIALITALVVITMIISRRKAVKARKLGFSSSSSYCQEDDGKVFDAYICYSSNNTSFVHHVLASKLENGSPSYKLCLHNRDYNESSRLSEFMTQSVCFSRKTILVISRSFVDNEWKDPHFRRSMLDSMRMLENSLVVVNFDGVSEVNIDHDLRSILKKSHKVKWGDKYFWKKLGEELPVKSVYSAFSLYISDPLYKSPVPLLSPPQTADLPSSSSVLTSTTGLTTPSDVGLSFQQEQPITYKAPPPPRPCPKSSCEYMYMSNRGSKEKSNCSCHSITQPVYNSADDDAASVHSYNSLEILSHQRNDRQSSPESHHYSIINAAVSPVIRKSKRRRMKCRSSQGSPGSSYDNVLTRSEDALPVTPLPPCQRKCFKGNFKSREDGGDDFVSSSSSSSLKLNEPTNNEKFDESSPSSRTLPEFLSEECFV